MPSLSPRSLVGGFELVGEFEVVGEFEASCTVQFSTSCHALPSATVPPGGARRASRAAASGRGQMVAAFEALAWQAGV